MNFEKISTAFTAQLPLLFMALSNGTCIYDIIPLLLVPIIIYMLQSVPDIINLFKKPDRNIPQDYVHYTLDDGSSINDFTKTNFVQDLSLFLNVFCSTSIKSGCVKKFEKNADKNTPFDCIHAIISPDNAYY